MSEERKKKEIPRVPCFRDHRGCAVFICPRCGQIESADRFDGVKMSLCANEQRRGKIELVTIRPQIPGEAYKNSLSVEHCEAVLLDRESSYHAEKLAGLVERAQFLNDKFFENL